MKNGIVFKQKNIKETGESASAELDPTGTWRYSLFRCWNADAPLMVWIMLNPSTADALKDDPTIRKCRGFAKDWGFGGFVTVNLFALRATDPRRVVEAPTERAIGPHNDEAIRRAIKLSNVTLIVCGWGAGGGTHDRRDLAVGRLLDVAGRCPVACLGVTKAGFPRHPLYLPYTTPRLPMTF